MLGQAQTQSQREWVSKERLALPSLAFPLLRDPALNQPSKPLLLCYTPEVTPGGSRHAGGSPSLPPRLQVSVVSLGEVNPDFLQSYVLSPHS